MTDKRYVTPYYPLAFADGGRLLVARWRSNLFTLPISNSVESAEARDDE